MPSPPAALRHALETEWVAPSTLTPWSRNPRRNDAAAKRLAVTIEAHGWTTPVLVQSGSGRVIAGHTRLKAAALLGLDRVPVVRLDVDDRQADAIAIADNRLGELAEWDADGLAELLREFVDDDLDIGALGWADDELAELLAPPPAPSSGPSLADRFVVPPFSVLDQRQGYWQERRERWLSRGIRSEEGRGTANERDGVDRTQGYSGGLVGSSVSYADPGFYAKKRAAEAASGGPMDRAEFVRDHYVAPTTGGLSRTGTSVFDPVLCELACRWFAPVGGSVLDPFAGGSVRGVVAGLLGFHYVGIELRGEQVAANREQWGEIGTAGAPEPVWIEGDSRAVLPTLTDAFDLVFTCPPYFDLEVYSDDPSDLSAGSWEDFADGYAAILMAACGRLRDDRFAVVVVGDVRDKRGAYRGVVDLTRTILINAGLMIWNEAILVEPVGSKPIRAGRQFAASRKLVRAHQVVVVAYKGDPARIRDLGEVVVGQAGGDDE